jgi:hypothetical protein
MDFVVFLINILIITLILIRVPNVNTSAMDIDQNPKFLNPSISFFISILLGNIVYSSIVA